jgi:Zn finger protein HypA/HybF involved in hydrogenase expression
MIHKENDFDTRIEYTYVSKEMEQADFSCPNCGMQSKVKDFEDGCPYCGSYYNIDFTDKELGSKLHYDRVLRSNKYRVITAIIDIIISLIIAFIFIKTTSRTFNNIDIIKIFLYGIILSMILYYFFYIVDAYIVLSPIKKYKDAQNQKQIDFWNKMNIDKKSFFNNLNYEIRNYYYSKDNIIDYDILDYTEFKDYKKDDKEFIDVEVELRLVVFENNKIKSNYIKDTFTMMKNINGKLELKDGVNVIKCHNCGATIDATEKMCSYCHTEIKYLQDWILQK